MFYNKYVIQLDCLIDRLNFDFILNGTKKIEIRLFDEKRQQIKVGDEILFDTSSGNGFPEELGQYKMVIHCGGCILNKKEMQYRLKQAKEQNVPMVNYGVMIAYLKGILKRSLEPFEGIRELLE